VRAEELAQRTVVEVDLIPVEAGRREPGRIQRVDESVDGGVGPTARACGCTAPPLIPRLLGLARGIGRGRDARKKDTSEQIGSVRPGVRGRREEVSDLGPSGPMSGPRVTNDVTVAFEDSEVKADRVRVNSETLGEFDRCGTGSSSQLSKDFGAPTPSRSRRIRPAEGIAAWSQSSVHDDSLSKRYSEQTRGAFVSEEAVIDVRTIPKPERHPLIIDAYEKLDVGAGLILVNDHVPEGLRVEMVREFADAVGWEPLESSEDAVRVRIVKQAATPTPRVVLDVAEVAGTEAESGSVWQLPTQQRDLDANVIALAPGGEIREHTGPNLDVLIHILDGAGTLETETGTIDLSPGQIVWLPRLSRRRFTADAENGLKYFSVHQRKQGLTISARP
jgi:uncharacterized protein (DUF2249 family)